MLETKPAQIAGPPCQRRSGATKRELTTLMSLWIAGLTAALVYGGLIVFLVIIQPRLIYHPQPLGQGAQSQPSTYGLDDFEVIAGQDAPDRSLVAWMHLPSEPGRRWIIFFHGNAGHLGDREDKFRIFADAGYGVLAPTYRYNTVPDFYIEEHLLLEDARRWVRWLHETQGAPPNEVILYGESLGGAVAVGVGATMAPAAMVIEGSFSSVSDMAKQRLPFVPISALLRDRWLSAERSERLRAPVLFLHHQGDRVVPQMFGRALFEAYGGADFPDKTFVNLPSAFHVFWPDRRPPTGLMEFLQASAKKTTEKTVGAATDTPTPSTIAKGTAHTTQPSPS